jgi:hypothetical protein
MKLLWNTLRILIGLIFFILAIGAVQKSLFSGVLLLGAFVIAIPFFSKKIKLGFIPKAAICAVCVFAGTVLFANSSNKEIAGAVKSQSAAGIVKENTKIPIQPLANPSPQIDWKKYTDEFQNEIRSDGGKLSKVKNIDFEMDEKGATTRIVMTPVELQEFTKLGPMKSVMEALLEGMVVLQVNFAKENNLPTKDRSFYVHLHLAEEGILNPVRFKKLAMASYNPNTDSVDIKFK